MSDRTRAAVDEHDRKVQETAALVSKDIHASRTVLLQFCDDLKSLAHGLSLIDVRMTIDMV
jgi:hypothetical protein